MDRFVERHRLPKLASEAIDNLSSDNPLTIKEIKFVVKKNFAS
jgi:hypothetical protein